MRDVDNTLTSQNDIDAMESCTDITKIAILRAIEELKRQFITERIEAGKLKVQYAEKVAEIAKLKIELSKLSEANQVLEEIRSAIEETNNYLKNESERGSENE